MFMGEFYYTLDSKGRLSIPAKFRQILDGKNESNLIVTKGLDRCLFVLPFYEWPSWEDKIKSLTVTQAANRAFVRIMIGGACDAQMSKQGRILLPYSLRKYAEIDREVVIIGVSNRMEIWSKNNWEEYAEKMEGNFEEISEKIEGFNF